MSSSTFAQREREGAYWLRFAGLYGMLAVIAAGALLAFAKMAFTNVRVETHHTVVAPKTAGELIKALGSPAQTIAGEQINENLKGATCSIYQPKDGLEIICTA